MEAKRTAAESMQSVQSCSYVVVVAERHEEAEQEARLHELRERVDAVLGADEVVRHRGPRHAVRLLLAEHVCALAREEKRALQYYEHQREREQCSIANTNISPSRVHVGQALSELSEPECVVASSAAWCSAAAAAAAVASPRLSS